MTHLLSKTKQNPWAILVISFIVFLGVVSLPSTVWAGQCRITYAPRIGEATRPPDIISGDARACSNACNTKTTLGERTGVEVLNCEYTEKDGTVKESDWGPVPDLAPIGSEADANNRLENASGDPLSAGVNYLKNVALAAIISAISVIVGVLLMLGSMVMDVAFTLITGVLMDVVKFNNFTEIKQIVEVWKVMRDLANMFFIVVVLVIAFGTMLRLEKYEWKHLLPKLVFAALFINFSRAICGVVIDISQVVMLTFVNAFEKAGIGNFQHLFSVTGKLFELSTKGTAIGLVNAVTGGLTGGGIGTGASSSIFVLISIFLAFGYLVTAVTTMFTMLGLLIFRIVALWILVMLSPIAFVLFTFPEGEDYANKWLQQFTANVLVGPVLAFFIWLALLVNQTSGASSGKLTVGAAPTEDSGVAGNLLSSLTTTSANFESLVSVKGLGATVFTLGPGATFGGSLDPANFVNMIISVTILGIGMSVANELGSAGAEMVKGAAEHITGAGKWMAGGALATTDRLAAGIGKSSEGPLSLLSYMSPKSLKAGYEKFRHQVDHETYTGAEGKIQDKLHEIWNPTLGMGRVVADANDRRIDKNLEKDIAKVNADPTLQGEDKKQERAAKISALTAEAQASKKTLAFLRYEGLSGRTGHVYQKMEEEKGITEFAGQLAATGYTAEQLAQIALQNSGSGNIHMLQALVRTMLNGNNQDDFSRVKWLNEQKDLLSNNGGRGSRMESEYENAIITIQMQNANKDQDRSAGASEASDFTYAQFEAEKETKLRAADAQVDAEVKEGKITKENSQAEKDKRRAQINQEYKEDEGELFNADHTAQQGAYMFNTLATKSDVKEFSAKTGKWDTVTKKKNATRASQSDFIHEMDNQPEQKKTKKEKAFLRGYSPTITNIMQQVPPEARNGNVMVDINTFMQADVRASDANEENSMKGMLEFLQGKYSGDLQLSNGVRATVEQVLRGEFQRSRKEVMSELKEKVYAAFTGLNGIQKRNDPNQRKARAQQRKAAGAAPEEQDGELDKEMD